LNDEFQRLVKGREKISKFLENFKDKKFRLNSEIQKGDYMKKALVILSVFVLMVLGVQSSWAATSSATTMNPVFFYVVDSKSDTDSLVTLTVSGLPYGNYFEVGYSTDNVHWTDILITDESVADIVFNTGSNGNSLKTYWRTDDTTTGNVTFLNPFEPGSSLFQAVNIKWSSGSDGKQFSVASNLDKVSPVPIPGSLLLLGSGAFGLAMFRGRRKAHA
jgi:hypothetical protein